MLTWVDHYVSIHASNYNKLRREEIAKDPRKVSALPVFATPLDCVRNEINALIDTLQKDPARLEKLAASSVDPSSPWADPELIRQNLVSQIMLAAAIYPILENLRPLCIQPTMELLEDFYGAEAPNADDWKALVMDHPVTYIDLPSGAFSLAGGFHVRAIFLTPYPGDEINVTLSIIKDGPFSLDNAVEAQFLLGTAELAKKSKLPERSIQDITSGEFLSGTSEIIVNDVATGKKVSLGVSPLQLNERLSHFIKLILLYYLTHRESGQAVSRLPQIDESTYRRMSEVKRRNKTRHASLFSIIKLSSPPSRFGRTDQGLGEGGSWTLTRQVSVRGHFRFQPYGPGSKLRRLTWIDGYRKGLHLSEPSKPTLVQID